MGRRLAKKESFLEKEILSTAEAAEFLGAHIESIRRLARSGELPSFKIGKDWRFQKHALQQWIDKGHSAHKAPLILIVDDEDSFRKSISTIIKASGYRTMEAGDGQEGLNIISMEKPDMIFLDLAMPVMDGAEFITQLRARGETIPVVILTGYPDSDLVQKALLSGPIMLLTKPAPLKQIIQAIDFAINHSLDNA